jgi:hypothetical protein
MFRSMNGFATRVFPALLLTLGVASAVAFAVPDLVLLGLFLFILPGLILGLSPTILFYLLIFAAPFLVLRRANKVLAVAAGAAAVLAIAFGVPWVVNEKTEQALDAAVQSDVVPATPIPPARTIALLPEGGYNRSCVDLCLLILYNGVAERVISPALAQQRTRQPTLFRIERRATCDAGPIGGRTWTSEDTALAIAHAARLREAAGECLIAEPPGDAVPDLTIIRRDDTVRTRDWDRLVLRASHIDSHSVEVTAGGSVLARIGERKARMLLAPLFLNLPMSGGGGGFQVGPWEWGRRDTDSPQLDVLSALGRLTSFDLSIPRGTDLGVPSGTDLAVPSGTALDPLRQRIDAVLDDVTAVRSDGRFALIGDYYKALDDSGLQPGDSERLVRLIADDRVQLFQRFPPAALRLDDAAERFRGPLLARLSRLPAEQRDATYTLQQIAGRLPPGAYRDDYAVLDALLATREGLLRFPALIPRLVDRGNAVVPRLLAIMREFRGGSLKADDHWRSGGVAAAALQGLCMLGPDAAAALPELRQIAAQGVIPPNMQRGDRWRMSMVKIGAEASEFEKPSNVSGTQSRYEERMARDAQRRSCTSF